MSRLQTRFAELKQQNRAALVTFVTAGDPDYATSLAILKGLPAAGADVIELGMPFTDPTGGFKCFRREVLAAIDLDGIHSNGYSFQVEMTHAAWHLGFRIVESPITFEERREGQSKMSGGIINEALFMVWKLWARCGYRRRPRTVHPQSVAAPGGRGG